MRKKEQGVLTVEATMVLMVFVMFVLFLYNFAGVYRAQSTVSHAVIESADAIALESYLREVAFESDPQEVIYLASKLGGSSTLDANALESLRTADLPKLAKEKFITAVAKDEAEADAKLKQLGIKGGLSGINFSKCYADLDGDNIIVFVEYVVELQFPLFGAREMRVTKAAKAKTFGEILYSVSTSSNNPVWGNTSGDNRVEHGAYVEISATPNYGYRFVKWDDGNTDNPRRVLVTNVAKYKAIFEPTDIGINLYLRRTHTDESFRWDEEQEYGTVTGSGNYTYMKPVTISATAKEHYRFVGWDDNGDGLVDSTENPRKIVVDKTRNITALYEGVQYKITILCDKETYGKVHYSYERFNGDLSGYGKELMVEYKHKVDLAAAAETTYRFVQWENNDPNADRTVEVLGDATYVAYFEKDTCKVAFYNGNKEVHIAEVVRGSSINGSTALTKSAMPAEPAFSGRIFDRWTYNGKTFTERTSVNSDIRVDAVWKCEVILNAMGGTVNGEASQSYEISCGGSSSALPLPIRLGYRFGGWKLHNTTYNEGATLQNITSNVTLEAQWSQCTSHEWGRCGVTHTYSYAVPLSKGGAVHYTTQGQCILCADCGMGAYTKNWYGIATETWSGVTGDYYGCSDIMWGQYCFGHSGCADLFEDNRVYPIHSME